MDKLCRIEDLVDDYIDDAKKFIETQGVEGELCWLKYCENKLERFTFQELLIDALWDKSVMKAFNTLLVSANQKNVDNFNQVLKKYAIETWLNDVVDWRLEN